MQAAVAAAALHGRTIVSLKQTVCRALAVLLVKQHIKGLAPSLVHASALHD